MIEGYGGILTTLYLTCKTFVKIPCKMSRNYASAIYIPVTRGTGNLIAICIVNHMRANTTRKA